MLQCVPIGVILKLIICIWLMIWNWYRLLCQALVKSVFGKIFYSVGRKFRFFSLKFLIEAIGPSLTSHIHSVFLVIFLSLIDLLFQTADSFSEFIRPSLYSGGLSSRVCVLNFVLVLFSFLSHSLHSWHILIKSAFNYSRLSQFHLFILFMFLAELKPGFLQQNARPISCLT
jgi:hypothetical protein